MSEFNSPIFGPTRNATSEEIEAIEGAVREVPVAVFAALNKALNARGLCISIDAIEGTS